MVNKKEETVKTSRPIIGAIAVVSVAVALPYAAAVNSQGTVAEARSRFDNKTRRERFTHNGTVQAEFRSGDTRGRKANEAPTGFDNLTNGYLKEQGPDLETITEDNVRPGASFNDNRFIFEEVEHVEDGLGPTYNGQSCAECHQNVATGGASQVTEHRTGYLKDGEFFESVGGSLVHSRATYPDIVEHVYGDDTVRTFRISTNTLGNGFVEAVANSTLLSIQARQPAAMRGTAVMVAVLEAAGQVRIGRFGLKDQHGSLESFAADAYLNEMGITSPLFPDENKASLVDENGNRIAKDVGFGTDYDPVDELEDDGEDVVAFADFIRSTKAPSRGPIDAQVQAGDKLFNQIGCGICHTPSIVTAAPGTRINGGKLTVPETLGNKIIHPYSDFLLHDVGTGDGIPVLPTPEYVATAYQMRTAPLWGLRTRNRLMHDGLSFTNEEAILRHGGQATGVTKNYNSLSQADKTRLLKFLNSL
jgi:CxxC motif-containing protein (DUF1111 family)